jgi:DNA-binding NtrC family response regulator
VDDERGILESLQRLLTCANYKALLAESGQEALDLIAKEMPDLVIVDQRMPHMTGSEFLRIARGKYPKMRAIMLSGYSDFEGLVSAVNEGEVFRFISKPWQNQLLLEAIASAVEKKNMDDFHKEGGVV